MVVFVRDNACVWVLGVYISFIESFKGFKENIEQGTFIVRLYI